MVIELLNDKNFPALRRFTEQVWDRPDCEDYYRWRYTEAPGLVTVVAMEDDQCIATISAFSKPYFNGTEMLECLEPFDWHAHPSKKGSGAGLRVMKYLMRAGKPIVGFGGTPDALNVLPLLGFKQICEAAYYVLPLTTRYLLRNRKLPAQVKHLATPAMDAAASLWFRPGKPGRRSKETLLPVSGINRDLTHISGPGGFRSAPDAGFYRWLMTGFTDAGTYLPFVLAIDGEAVAWALGRLHRVEGLLHGTFIDIRLRGDDEQLALSIIGRMASAMAGFGVDQVNATSASPLLGAAFRNSGFRTGREKIPGFVWPGTHKLKTDVVALNMLHGDGAFIAMPNRSQHQRLCHSPVTRQAAFQPEAHGITGLRAAGA